MLLIDLPVPKSCRECLLSCQIPNVPPTDNRVYDEPYDPSKMSVIICRRDYKIHTVMDKGCPIKKEIKEDEINE